jgi:hypothetical protein
MLTRCHSLVVPTELRPATEPEPEGDSESPVPAGFRVVSLPVSDVRVYAICNPDASCMLYAASAPH